MGLITLAALGCLVLGVVVAQFLPTDLLGLRSGSTESQVSDAEHAPESLWTCGMHPHVIEEQPGQCPICGMDLTPMDAGSPADVPSEPAEQVEPAETWACADFPEIKESGPGLCPIDGTELVKVTEQPATGDAHHDHAHSTAHGTHGSPRPMTAGAVVDIDPAVVQQMNVRIERAQRRDLTRPIRTVGYLEYDQQRMVTVTTKYSGWIEKVKVNYVGEKVRRGQPLFEIYSPELVQTEQELLSALDFAREMAEAPEDARRRAWSMVESARTRLGYWDVSAEQIERLEQTGEVFRTLEVAAPAGGLVMKRMPGLEGMAVQPGMELFHIADLQSLWVSVELYEDQVASVREGTPAVINLSYFPGESFNGRVRFLEPELSDTTRTMRAKIEVPNRGGRLRKGMYATVDLQPVEVRDALSVPVQSVLRTGQRNLVVVALGDGRFEPRPVTLGHEAQGYAQVLDGVGDGEDVVTSAQFLLDSESTLREAIQKMLSERRSASGQASSP